MDVSHVVSGATRDGKPGKYTASPHTIPSGAAQQRLSTRVENQLRSRRTFRTIRHLLRSALGAQVGGRNNHSLVSIAGKPPVVVRRLSRPRTRGVRVPDEARNGAVVVDRCVEAKNGSWRGQKGQESARWAEMVDEG